ncbi:glycosyltransferase [Thermovorax subterraneus]|nr:glycosyltransferase [Thermovorax subterraneus]
MLTVFLKWSADKIKNKEDVIRSLLDKNVEVIVINNESLDPYISINEDISVPKYEFFGAYNQLKEYCSQLTLNDLFLIWEEDQDILIEKILRKIESGKPCIYSCNYKFVLNDGDSCVKKLPLIFTKDEGAEEKFLEGVFVLDKSLVNVDLGKIEDILWWLFDIGDISMIGDFLTIVKNKKNYLLEKKFYESAEKIKQFSLYEEVVEMDRNLMKLAHIEDDYRKYLTLKVGLLERVDTEGIEHYADIFKIENLYVAYILKYLMENQLIDEFIKIARIVNLEVLKVYLAYLLSNFEDFYRTFYKFMIAVDAIKEISIRDNPRVDILMELAKTYIVSMSDKSHDIEKKQMLIQMFVDYCNYGIYVTNKLLKSVPKYLNQEAKFIVEIDKVIGNINSNKIEQAIENLQNAAKIYPPMEQAVLYYIERLRLENSVKKYKLSICMIVRDEEKYLRRCLESLKPLVQSGLAELIIVDTGSKDNTINIAKEYTDKVYLHPWQGSFSEARNYSISLAQGEYIFIIDADEELEEGGAEKLIEFFSGQDYKDYNAFTFKIKNFASESFDRFGICTQALIFKNDGTFYYTGKVHNQPVYKKPIKHLDIFILHYGYIMNNDEVRERKFKRTATLLKKELAKNPNDIYYRFQLSVSYSMYGDDKEALRHVKIYLKNLEKKSSIEKRELNLYGHAVRVFLKNELYDDVINLSEKVLKVQDDYIDLLLYYGFAYYKKGDYKNAVKYLERYLDILEDFYTREIANDDSMVFYSLHEKDKAVKILIHCYYEMKDYEKICTLCKKVNFKANINSLAEILPMILEAVVKSNDFGSIKQFADELQKIDVDYKYIEYIVFSIMLQMKENMTKELLDLFEICKINDNIFKKIRNFNDFIFNNNREAVIDEFFTGLDYIEINEFKKYLKFILSNPYISKNISEGKIVKLLDYYLQLCMYLISSYREELLEEKEILFLNCILDAFEYLNKGKSIDALRCLKNSVEINNEMAIPMQIYVNSLRLT